LYRFCTADSAFEPFLLFRLFGESITYMLSTLLHSSIPTSSTKFNLVFQPVAVWPNCCHYGPEPVDGKVRYAFSSAAGAQEIMPN
jgi:hypothetical protein